MQPNTYLMDAIAPNEQAVAEHQPIIWTLNRIYSFLNQIPTSANKFLAYKSIDDGITWTTPDSANAIVVHAFADWDGPVANIVTFGMFAANSGTQSPFLQTFDLNAETYSASFGHTSTGVPSVTLSGPCKVAVMSNGKIFLFFGVLTIPAHSRVKFAVYDPGTDTWTTSTTDVATNVVGNDSQWETIIPDPAHNLCHVYYSDTGNNFYYRQIQSDGTLGGITTFSSGWNIFLGNLNQGKAFNTGFLDAVNNNLVTPVFTRNPVSHIYSLAVVTGTPISSPVFTISPAIDTAANFNPGQDIGQAIAYNASGTYHVLYFMGDGTNNYNLVKLATLSMGTWTTVTLYDATLDPNAGQNIHNGQWINALSGSSDSLGNFVFQIATWLTLPGQSFQNTATITTLVGSPTPPAPVIVSPYSNTGYGWFQFAKGLQVLRVVLPDPKLCKSSAQLNARNFQKGFTIE